MIDDYKISRKNIPARFPLTRIVVYLLVLVEFNAHVYLYALYALYVVAEILMYWTAITNKKHVDLFKNLKQ